MLNDTVAPIRLSDYRPSDYAIDRIALDFDLRADETLVRAELAVSPRDGIGGKPLVLDGDELTLVSVALDGEVLGANSYQVQDTSLTISSPPQGAFTLTIVTRLDPAANTKLMGLYRSSGAWCTQCEAEGFRRITYFLDRPDVLSVYRVRMEADAKEAPVLLSNGNLVESGDCGNGRHFAVWDDPWPKPSYLFALVAGDLEAVKDSFTTKSGRHVDLAVYVEHGNGSKALYAMDSLKRSMKWDEDVFGREYDLDVFNVVAVSDFNMGAMENKGLNIFNDKYVLADADIATDGDYAGVESVIAHEYFHNWTGNRITCRDWFQLCLKEGLTVFRDQEFSADERSRPVKRIADVKVLRSHQFPEDGGPLAHPVRPNQYKEINNFYTATVYEKGAEVIRMLKTLIGDDAFARGMTLYFDRHDGQAATIEEFVACFAETSARDLSQFMNWYFQAGTPVVTVAERHDEASQTYELVLSQETPPTPGQPSKLPQVIPVRFGLVGSTGNDLRPSRISGAETSADVFILDKAQQTIVFEGLSERPVPSLFRAFSAPVKVRHALSSDDQVFLIGNDADPFNRWQAATSLSMAAIVKATHQARSGQPFSFDTAFAEALGAALDSDALDPAFKALLMSPPGENDIAREISENIDPDAIHTALMAFRRFVASRLAPRFARLVQDGTGDIGSGFSPDAASAGKRALANAALDYLALTGESSAFDLTYARFQAATNMTDRLAALSILVHRGAPQADEALAAFYARFSSVPLVVDKWLATQATVAKAQTLDKVIALTADPAFSFGNPNRVRSLIGSFASLNPTQFARADGKGFDYVAQTIGRIDDSNPQLASRLLVSFRSWRSYEQGRRSKAEKALRALQAKEKLSRDVSDILERTLA
ncbi:aminopeptidase N [Oryzibacter oryziterrae]|uniref:aminopeptidase N n=1 Tax=Oryzibacter oryziterrae TaxID=2766474 RepID=UPI001F012C3E|nr:aminopeptidase N [Oryzibacter oryziterrae]